MCPKSNKQSKFRHRPINACRRKMRMSGLCKVEMSAFMDVQGPHGDGANHFEPTRTGPIESVARGTGEASFASSSSGTAESNRPPGAADAAADSRARGWCPVQNRCGVPQVLPAYGLQDLWNEHRNPKTKSNPNTMCLQITLGEDLGSGHFYLAENRTFLLCVDMKIDRLPRYGVLS